MHVMIDEPSVTAYQHLALTLLGNSSAKNEHTYPLRQSRILVTSHHPFDASLPPPSDAFRAIPFEAQHWSDGLKRLELINDNGHASLLAPMTQRGSTLLPDSIRVCTRHMKQTENLHAPYDSLFPDLVQCNYRIAVSVPVEGPELETTQQKIRAAVNRWNGLHPVSPPITIESHGNAPYLMMNEKQYKQLYEHWYKAMELKILQDHSEATGATSERGFLKTNSAPVPAPPSSIALHLRSIFTGGIKTEQQATAMLSIPQDALQHFSIAGQADSYAKRHYTIPVQHLLGSLYPFILDAQQRQGLILLPLNQIHRLHTELNRPGSIKNAAPEPTSQATEVLKGIIDHIGKQDYTISWPIALPPEQVRPTLAALNEHFHFQPPPIEYGEKDGKTHLLLSPDQLTTLWQAWRACPTAHVEQPKEAGRVLAFPARQQSGMANT